MEGSWGCQESRDHDLQAIVLYAREHHQPMASNASSALWLCFLNGRGGLGRNAGPCALVLEATSPLATAGLLPPFLSVALLQLAPYSLTSSMLFTPFSPWPWTVTAG